MPTGDTREAENQATMTNDNDGSDEAEDRCSTRRRIDVDHNDDEDHMDEDDDMDLEQ